MVKNLRFYLSIVISVIFLLGLVIAVHVVTMSIGTTSASYNELVNFVFNITVNNTDPTASGNVTQLNITLPTRIGATLANFTYTSYSNVTLNTAATEFSNTSNVLTWQNFTYWIFNSSIGEIALSYFQVNLTAPAPGQYNISITTLNATKAYYSNISVIINDTTAPTIYLITPVNNSRYTASHVVDFYYNVSDSSSISNCSLIVNRSRVKSASSITKDTTLNLSFHFDSGTGQYNWTINCTDAANNTATTTGELWRNLTVRDITAPQLPVAFPINRTNLSYASVSVNFTASENFDLFNCWYSNSSGEYNYSLDDCTSNLTKTWDEGLNTLLIWANDTSSNVNFSTTSFIIDRVQPTITFSCSPLQIQLRGTITCSCTTSDATTGINSSSYTINPATATPGEFTTSCTATDYVGNFKSSSVTYIVTSSSGSLGGGGGGSSTSTTTEITSSQFANGYTKSMSVNQQIKFKINNESHYADLQSLATNSVTIVISSNPQTATFNIGEEKKFELTGDRIYDLSVKLNSISGSSASITVKSIAEQMPESATTTSDTITTGTETTPATTTSSMSKIQLLVIAIIIVVVVIILVVYLLTRKKKR